MKTEAKQENGENLEKIILTSTSEIYGSAKFVPITEDHPVLGQSPYSASKIAADQLALSFYKSFKTPITILRPFNTYGPRQSARAIIPTIGDTYNVSKDRFESPQPPQCPSWVRNSSTGIWEPPVARPAVTSKNENWVWDEKTQSYMDCNPDNN